jgi:hypothetical protein
MGGFLGGLGELLLGANSLKRIKDDGFDWREQDKFKDFERNKAREQYGTSLAKDYLTATDEPDESVAAQAYGPDVDRKRLSLLLGAAGGQARQSKSSLRATDAYYDAQLEDKKQAGRVDLLNERSKDVQELETLRERHRRERTLSPADTAKMKQLEDLERARIAKYGTGGGRGGGRGSFDKIVGANEQGVAGTWRINRDTNEREFFPSNPTVGTRGKGEARGTAITTFTRLLQNFDAIGEAPEDGLEARARGAKLAAQAAAGYVPSLRTYKKGVRGFVPLMARALGHVGVLTELDVERSEELFPTEFDTREEKAQKVDLLNDIMAGNAPLPWQLGSLGGKPIAYVGDDDQVTDYGGQGAAPQNPLAPLRSGAPPKKRKYTIVQE